MHLFVAEWLPVLIGQLTGLRHCKKNECGRRKRSLPVLPSFEGRLGSAVPNLGASRDPVLCYSRVLPVVCQPIPPIPDVIGPLQEGSFHYRFGAIRIHARDVHLDRSLKTGGRQSHKKQDAHLVGDGLVPQHRVNLLHS